MKLTEKSMEGQSNTGNTENSERMKVTFAAIDPYIEVNRILPVETRNGGNGMINWGTRNIYPTFLYSLYEAVPTLGSVIEGTVNFVSGDNVTVIPFGTNDGIVVNRLGDTVTDLVRELARDYLIYGGFAIQVIKDITGAVAELYWIDMRYLRSNKDNTVFFYSEKWDKPGLKKTVIYPAFMPDTELGGLDEAQRKMMSTSIYFFKENRRRTYPTPIYIQAIKSCDIERCIDEYHLNAINNGFSDGILINFNNGVPEDKIKEQIEKAINEKFAGQSNAARIMISWNPNKESQTNIQSPQTRDYGEKYNSLATRSRQQIFTAFRANPNLFGIPTDNNGFSNEEYTESFGLYNRTQVKPIQDRIRNAFARILGNSAALSITPFSTDGIASEGE